MISMLDNFLFIFDENIPFSVLSFFSNEKKLQIYSIHQNNTGCSDEFIINFSRERNGVIITFDKDFGYLAYSRKKSPFGIILLRFSPKSPQYIKKMLNILFDQIINLDIELNHKFIVFDGKKIRVRNIE